MTISQSSSNIDILIQSGEQLQPVEIKSGQTLNQDYFKGLRKWLDIAGPLAEDPTLIYGGDQALTHFGTRVLPWRDPAWRTFS